MAEQRLTDEQYNDIAWWFLEELDLADRLVVGRALMTIDLPEAQAIRDVVAQGDQRDWDSEAMKNFIQAWLHSLTAHTD